MTEERPSPDETGGARRMALASGFAELKSLMAGMERHLAVFEKDVETCPISKRRGRWIERSVPAWTAEARVKFATARKKFRLALWLSGGRKHLDALEARQTAAFARLAERAAEERAKGWPLKTLYDAGPEVG